MKLFAQGTNLDNLTYEQFEEMILECVSDSFFIGIDIRTQIKNHIKNKLTPTEQRDLLRFLKSGQFTFDFPINELRVYDFIFRHYQVIIYLSLTSFAIDTLFDKTLSYDSLSRSTFRGLVKGAFCGILLLAVAAVIRNHLAYRFLRELVSFMVENKLGTRVLTPVLSRTNANDFDLQHYLDHIGYTGDLLPTMETLKQIITLHNRAFLYRNKMIFNEGKLLVTERTVPSLAAQTIFTTMVNHRGGYCYQHQGLLHAALSALEFKLTYHLAQMILQPTNKIINYDNIPTTHGFLMVKLNDKRYIVDTGVGHASLREPLEYKIGEVCLGTDEYRLRAVANTGFHALDTRMKGKSDWFCLYKFHSVAFVAATIHHYQNELFTTPDFRRVRDEINYCGSVDGGKRRYVCWFEGKEDTPRGGVYYCEKNGTEKKKVFKTFEETEAFSQKKFGVK